MVKREATDLKKILILLLVMLMAFAGCGEEKNPLATSTGEEAQILPDEDSPAKMRVVSVSERSLKVEIENTSENEISFSDDFNIQIFENGKWCSLEIIPEDAVFTEPAYGVEPGKTGEQEISFAWLYGSLSEGEYRIVKRIIEFEDGTYKGTNAAAEFSFPFVLKEESPNPEEPDEAEKPENPEEPAETNTPEEPERIPEEEKPFGEPPSVPEEPGTEEKPGFSGNMSGQISDSPAIENTFVLRANGYGAGSEETMWHLYAANEKNGKNDSPIMVFHSAEKLKSFYMDMEGTYDFRSGENSPKEKILSYDEKYFEENSLIIIHIQSNSGSVRYSVTDISVSGGNCSITVNAKIPEVGTADMADWFILIEQPKAALEDCENFSMKVTV